MIAIDRKTVDRLAAAAQASPRQRANHNLHGTLTDPVQRFLNAIEPGSYVRPHRHLTPPKWELFIAISGRAVALGFDETGRVTARCELAPDATVAVEIGEAEWHTVAALEPGTVLMEVKPGPYRAVSDKDFAPWAPPEGDDRCDALARWFTAAQPGEVIAG